MKSKTMFKHVPLCLKTGKFYYFLSSLIFVLFLLPAVSHAAPKLFFSDLDSGPKTGWEGSTTKGAAVTVWGAGFGATRGSNTITVNGAQLTTASDYAEWGTTGLANGIPRGLERTTFWIPSSAADGAGQITITVNGETSNALSFAVSPAKIYFVSVADGNNTYNGLYSTFQSGSNGPFRDIKMFNPGLNPSHDTESYIVYVKGGTYTALDVDGAFVALRGPYGASDRRHALIGYPGETPTIDTTNATRGIIWEADYSPYGPIDYMTISKLRGINGLSAIGLDGQYNRVVGNTFKDYLDNAWSGVVWVGSAKYASIYGNLFDHNGYDSYKHNIYIKTQVSFGSGDPSTHDIYVGWNEFSNPVASDTHGGVIFISKSSETAVASYPTRDIHIHDNYFHDGNEDFIYIGDGVAIGDVYIYNNIFKGGTSTNGGMSFNHGANDVYLYNNVFYQTGAGTVSYPGMLWGTGTTRAHFKNNVWYTNSGIPFIYWENYQGATFDSDHDLYFNPGGTITLPSGSGITVTNAGIGDPLFVNPSAGDFTLQSSSPAIDTGSSSVAAVVTKDFDGNTRPMGAGYDIGAYEVVDANAPSVQITSPTSESTYPSSGNYTGNLALSGTATPASGRSISSVTCTNGSGGTCSCSGTTSWTCNTSISSGQTNVNITVKATDNNNSSGIDVLVVNSSSGGGSDTQSPSAPTGLSAQAVSSSQINLSWTASTDDVGVTGYNIYRDGALLDTSATNSYSNTGLSASTAYTYTVSAYDAAGNESSQSSSASATTSSGSGSGDGGSSDRSGGGGGGGETGSASALNESGNTEISGGGCGFVKDDDSKGPRAKGQGLTLMMMLVMTLTGIAIARRFSNRFSYNL